MTRLIKLDSEQNPERLQAICTAKPDAGIIVDVNQNWNFGQLVDLAPRLKRLGVAMLEQPGAGGTLRSDDQCQIRQNRGSDVDGGQYICNNSYLIRPVSEDVSTIRRLPSASSDDMHRL